MAHSWLGILGSVRKIQLIKETLHQNGVPHQRLNQMHAPIGLNIGAQNPQEIAISVVAQLIAHRSKVQGPIQPKSHFLEHLKQI